MQQLIFSKYYKYQEILENLPIDDVVNVVDLEDIW